MNAIKNEMYVNNVNAAIKKINKCDNISRCKTCGRIYTYETGFFSSQHGCSGIAHRVQYANQSNLSVLNDILRRVDMVLILVIGDKIQTYHEMPGISFDDLLNICSIPNSIYKKYYYELSNILIITPEVYGNLQVLIYASTIN